MKYLLSVFALSLAACSGMKYSTTSGGKVIGGDAATVAQAQEAERKEAERVEKVKAAPKRGAQDPIYVEFQPTVLHVSLEESQKKAGRKDDIYNAFIKDFKTDPIIKFSQESPAPAAKTTAADRFMQRMNKTTPTTTVVADVVVTSMAKVSEEVGYAAKDKEVKIGKMIGFTFEGEVTSQYTDKRVPFKFVENVFRNEEAVKKATAKVRSIIIDEFGPLIPQDRVSFRRSN